MATFSEPDQAHSRPFTKARPTNQKLHRNTSSPESLSITSKKVAPVVFQSATDVLIALEIKPEEGIALPDLVATIVKKINTCGFTTGLQLLEHLLILFHQSEDDPTKSRILSSLNRWVDCHWSMFEIEVSELLEKLATETTKLPNASTQSAKYHKFFETVIAKILKKRVSAPSFQELLFGANFKEEQSQDNTLKWSTIHPIHFAHQLTLYHQLIYQSITEADIITYKPSFLHSSDEANEQSSEATHKEKPLIYFISHFNSLAKFVKVELLTETDTKLRGKSLKKFIALANTLLTLRNYNGLFSVMSGLTSSSVFRLADTWASVTQTSVLKQELDRALEFVSPQSGFAVYRKAVSDTTSPAIPFFGVAQTDLVHLADATPQKVGDVNINFVKHVSIGRTIRELLSFQEMPYTMAQRRDLLEFIHIQVSNPLSLSEDELYQKSLEIEPRPKKVPQPQQTPMPLSPKSKKEKEKTTKQDKKLKKDKTETESDEPLPSPLRESGPPPLTLINSSTPLQPNAIERQIEQILSQNSAALNRSFLELKTSVSLTQTSISNLESTLNTNMQQMKSIVQLLSSSLASSQQEISELKRDVATLQSMRVSGDHPSTDPNSQSPITFVPRMNATDAGAKTNMSTSYGSNQVIKSGPLRAAEWKNNSLSRASRPDRTLQMDRNKQKPLVLDSVSSTPLPNDSLQITAERTSRSELKRSRSVGSLDIPRPMLPPLPVQHTNVSTVLDSVMEGDNSISPPTLSYLEKIHRKSVSGLLAERETAQFLQALEDTDSIS